MVFVSSSATRELVTRTKIQKRNPEASGPNKLKHSHRKAITRGVVLIFGLIFYLALPKDVLGIAIWFLALLE